LHGNNVFFARPNLLNDLLKERSVTESFVRNSFAKRATPKAA
jgi:hypothetical protein